MAKKPKRATDKTVEALRYQRDDATRKNIPTAEYQSVLEKEAQDPVRVAYERRNRDLDPQLVWRGKDGQDWSDLVVQAPPLYIVLWASVRPRRMRRFSSRFRNVRSISPEAGIPRRTMYGRCCPSDGAWLRWPWKRSPASHWTGSSMTGSATSRRRAESHACRSEPCNAADQEDVYETERHLLYVACTRARDHLLVTGVSPASEFLEDLRA